MQDVGSKADTSLSTATLRSAGDGYLSNPLDSVGRLEMRCSCRNCAREDEEPSSILATKRRTVIPLSKTI